MPKLNQKKQQEYNAYVKQVTPTHNTFVNVCKAFLVGGIICVIGQCVLSRCQSLNLPKDSAGAWTSLSLVFLSALLTGLNVFPSVAKFGGAGALVPITGFANSIAAPAIEFQKEGQVFGIGCKIFTIAGPVILYGLCTSSLLGFIYYVLMLLGIV